MRWLACIDIRGEKPSPEELVHTTGQWAERAGAVVDVVFSDPYGTWKVATIDPGLQRQLRMEEAAQKERDRQHLAELADDLPDAVRGKVIVIDGIPEDEVLALSKDYDAVVVAAGKPALARALLGSVSSRIVRRAPVPVLVLRPGEGPGAHSD